MKKKKILISILISNFNKENFLKNCLKSVTKQKYDNFEVILFDDDSTDNSLKIIKKFKNIKLIRNNAQKKISSPLSQMRSLINCYKVSKGKIICFCDSDDQFDKKKLDIINSFFFKNPKKNFVINKVVDNGVLKLGRTNFSNSKWPSIFPTSCISVKRDFFKEFLKYALIDKLPNLEIDARMIIFSCFFYNNFDVIDNKLTRYTLDKKGISSKYKFLSSKWWLKRREAYVYLQFILKKRKKIFKKSFDYYITLLLSKIIFLIQS